MKRQGDVQIVCKVDILPSDAKLLVGRKELAFGEVTGHAHRVNVGDLFESKNGDLYLKVDTLANLSHEEHKTITLDPGIYRIAVKRQYTPAGWESVRD